jgi:hypothetical protein
LEQDLYLSATHGWNHYWGMGVPAGLYLLMPPSRHGGRSSSKVSIMGFYQQCFLSESGLQLWGEQASFPFDNHQLAGNGQNFNRNEPQLRDIIRDQLRITDEFGKKIHATDKLLEKLSARMDSTQNQLSFNKMLETHIQ